jgi:Holliday junction resolvase
MGVKGETSLQERIQKLIEKRGGYVNKNWGSMISEPGIADLTCCYKGLYLAIEVKVDKNTPSSAQGIHCRKVWKAGGIAVIVWTMEEVKIVLDILDEQATGLLRDGFLKEELKNYNIDDGTRW